MTCFGIFTFGLFKTHQSKAQIFEAKSYLDSLFSIVKDNEKASYIRVLYTQPDSVVEYYTSGQIFRSGKIRKGKISGQLEFKEPIFEYHRDGKIKREWDEERKAYLERDQMGSITSIRYYKPNENFSEVGYNQKRHLAWKFEPRKGIRGSIPTVLDESGSGKIFLSKVNLIQFLI